MFEFMNIAAKEISTRVFRIELYNTIKFLTFLIKSKNIMFILQYD